MINEVAPPGWGHTKAEKEKTKPNKPKSKIGGSSAAFKRALDDGRFKGLPGDKTKKEKTASMFKIMWAAKKKGYKPHYKPGTDEKYEKYKDKDEKNESFVLEREDSPYEKASDKALDKKYGYGTSHDKGPKTGFGRASNRATAAAVLKDIRRRRSKSTSETRADAAHKGWSHTARTSTDQTPEKKATRKKLADTPYKKLPKDEQEKDQVAADAVKKEYDKRKEQKEEKMTPMQDNNLFGNAYAGTPSPKKKKKKKLEEKVSGGRSKWLATAIEKEREQYRAQRRTAQAHKKSKESQKLSMAKRQSRIEASAKRNQVKQKKKESQKPKAPQFNAAKELVQDSPYMKPALQQRNEGVSFKNFYKTAKKAISKKQDERKPEKAMDAGARAKRKLQRREYRDKVSSFIPDELKD